MSIEVKIRVSEEAMQKVRASGLKPREIFQKGLDNLLTHPDLQKLLSHYDEVYRANAITSRKMADIFLRLQIIEQMLNINQTRQGD